jgi:hypothetical protein
MMRWLALFIVVLCMTPAGGADLTPQQPIKAVADVAPAPPDPAVLRQGGDTIDDAVPLTVPYDGGGTTTGYTDDYDIF